MLVHAAPEADAEASGGGAIAQDSALIWRWWSVEPDGSDPRREDALPTTAAFSYTFQVQSGVFLAEPRGDDATQLLDLADLRRPEAAILLPRSSLVIQLR
jgi:hypothetical protein